MISLSSAAQVFQYLPDEKSERLYSYDIKNNGSYKPNNAYSDSLLITKSNEYDQLVSNPSLSHFFTKSVQNYVFVGVNHDTNVVVPSAYVYNVALTVWCFNYASPGTPVAKNITLQVSYDPDSGVSYTDANIYKFSGYHKLIVEVTSIKDTSNNMILRSDLPKNFYVMSTVVVERYDDVAFTIYPWGTTINGGKTLNVTWGTSTNSSLGCTGTVTSNNLKPMEFELEWLYIDDYTYNIYNNGVDGTPGFSFNGSSTISYNFEHNSTRVRLTENSFDIPLIYEHGAIVYRVRALRPDYSNDYKTVIYGGWNLPNTGTVNLSHKCHAYFISTPHANDDLNWQYTINFAEEGKYKHVINYFDGTLRSRQSQTKINTDNGYVIAVDKIYDKEGRESIQTLPTPIQQDVLNYNSNLSLNTATGNPYKSSDFDGIACSTPDSIAPLSDLALAKKYYSPLNPDKGVYERFVPDAKGYPFIQSVYSPDNLLLWQGGAGYENQLWNGHSTRHEYVRATQSELNSLFGSEAGNFVHYPKQVTTDPNGQTSFTIHNPRGQAIASGLIGIPDTLETPIDVLPDYDTGFADCFSIAFTDQNKTSNSLFIESPFYGEKNGIYSLQYKVNIPAYNTGCDGKYLWAKAYYTYAATDDCGAPQIPATSGVIGKDSVLNSNVAMDLSGAAVESWLQKGKYLASKKLSFSRPEINVNVRQFVKDNEPDCYNDEHYFVRETVEAAAFPCKDLKYVDTTNPCEAKKRQMMDDLTPGGKYAKYGTIAEYLANGGFNNSSLNSYGAISKSFRADKADSNSIFRAYMLGCTMCGYPQWDPGSVRSFPDHGYYSYVHPYQDTVGLVNLPASVWKDGVQYTNIQRLPLDSFIYIFNDTIAEALLPLHPEYCKLLLCDGSLEEYENELKGYTTFLQAEYNNRFILDSILANDPIYKNASAPDKPLIEDKLIRFVNYNRRIDSIAIELAYAHAGNMEEEVAVAKFLYAQQIQNMTFVDDNVKQAYYELLKSFYLMNRSKYIASIYSEDEAFADFGYAKYNCFCPRLGWDGEDAHIWLTGTPVFDPYPPNIQDTSVLYPLLDSADVPQWIKDVYTDANDPNSDHSSLNPPPTQIQDTADSWRAAEAAALTDFVMDKLNNCSAVGSKLNAIRSEINSYCSTYGFAALTPQVVIDAITNPSGANLSLNDLCHPFLFGYTSYDISNEKEVPFTCAKSDIYDDLKDLINRTEVKNATMNAILTGSSVYTFNLNSSNLYENKIATKLGVSTSSLVSIKGFLDTVKYVDPANASNVVVKKYIKLKIYSASSSDTVKLYIKRKSGSAPHLDGATSLNTDGVYCINEDNDAAYTGYVARSTAILDMYINGAGATNRYYMWSNGINIMEPVSDESIAGAITCIDIKNAIDDFKSEKATYGYDDAYNHPLYQSTLTNYLNFKFNENHSYAEYKALMSGCAVTDLTEINKHFATIEVTCTTDTATFIQAVEGYTTRDIIESRILYSNGETHFGIDLSTVPDNSLLAYKSFIEGLVAPANFTYLSDKPLIVFDRTSCSPGTSLSTYMTPYTSNSVTVYINSKQYAYNMYTFNGSYTDAKNHSDIVEALSTYTQQCPGSYYVSDIAVLRSADYSTTDKQDYLAYVSGLTAITGDDIIDSIGTSNLILRIAGYGSNTLSYKDANCSKRKTDLYIYNGSQSGHWGQTLLENTILSGVQSALTTNQLFLEEDDLIQSGGSSLTIFRKANGVHWYRYFDNNNVMYNVYLAPPENPIYSIDQLDLDSIKIGPGVDSVTMFTAYMHYPSIPAVVFECRGYTDFIIGYGRKVENVILHTRPGQDYCLDTIDCEYWMLQDAIHAGKIRYLQYYDSTTNAMTDDMLAFLVDNANDSLKLCTQAQKNHIMRYYHDLAGNLVKTAPPPTGSDPFAVEKVSTYRYNSWNEIVESETPDGGTKKIFYDRAGRVVFSQDSKQQAENNYSYVMHDAQGRIKETGEVEIDCSSGCNQITNASEYTVAELENYIRNKVRYEVVQTYYDEEKVDLTSQAGYVLSKQENLLGRVSTIAYYKSKGTDYWSPFAEPNFGIYYSYDMLGNVKTVTYSSNQLIGINQKYKRVDYDYDQVSGKVNMLTYNRGGADQFYQKYKYDADNRITQVYTSNDGMLWNRDAEYTYYKHGPLANLKLGDDQLQSLDYAYAIQGWLKAVNGDILKPEKDMGQNGLPGDLSYARDVMAMAVNYYKNDYKPIDNSVAVTYLPEGDKSMYNGNIPRRTISLNSIGNLQRDYRYDQVQRIKLATYAEVDEDVLSVASPSNIFKSSYTYDAMGNINELNRYDNYGNHMDSLVYTYESGTNKLNIVEENIGATAAPHDLEQEPYTPVNDINYEYDNNGNMVRDYYGNQKISWDHFGKITDIVDTVTNTIIHYDYDGLGNRVRKDVIDTVSNDLIVNNGEYYVYDASGNLLTTYSIRTNLSPCLYISEANKGLYGETDFIQFLLDNVDIYGDFANQFVDLSIANENTWAVNITNSYGAGFYMQNDNDVFQLLLFATVDYLDDMVAFDMNMMAPQSIDHLFSSALVGGDLMTLFDQILDFQAEREKVFEHFFNNMPAGDLQNLWTAVGLTGTYSTNLFTFVSSIEGQMPGAEMQAIMEVVNAINNDPPPQNNAGNFLNAVVFDPIIFSSPDLRTPTPNSVAPFTMFEETILNALYNSNNPGPIFEFFDQWMGSQSLLDANVTLEEKMTILYNALKGTVLEDFIDNASDAAATLDKSICNTEGIDPMAYADAVVQHGTLGPLSAFGDGFVPIAEDTLMLAEHHIYGSQKLAVKNYGVSDGLMNTYNYDDADGTTQRTLSLNIPWYSMGFGDLVSTYPGATEPWGNTHTGEYYTSRKIGVKHFHISDQLGNVLAVVQDRKSGHLASPGDTLYDYWQPNLADVSDYYPFGMKMPGRILNNDTPSKYGFNGQRAEQDIYKSKSADLGKYNVHYQFKFREYDTRIARFWSVDPHASKYPSISPYASVNNNPIIYIDPDGRDYIVAINHTTKTVTIQAVYYTQIGDDVAYNSATQAADFWNGQSGVYDYQVGKGKDAINYTVNFDLSVKQVDNPAGVATMDRADFIDASQKVTPDKSSNAYLVLPDNDPAFNSNSEQRDINGVTAGGNHVSVKQSRSSSDTGPHEVGHTLGLEHFAAGLMTSASNDPTRSSTLLKSYIKAIIKNAIKQNSDAKGTISETGNAPVNYNNKRVKITD